jgi:TRAP-type mannitol/chloroaromatic compound transport system substrate-binding protein
MRRRDFLRQAGLGAAVGAAGCTPSTAPGNKAPTRGKKIRWRLASSFPRALDTIFGCAEVFAERLKAMTDGQFELRVHPAGELVPGLQVMDAVQQGTAQVGHTCSYYYTGKNPALAFDTCVPFGLTARQQTAWLMEAGGLQLIHGLFADFGILTFPGGNTGTQMGGWFKNDINSAADLKGLKMRIPGMGGKVMNRLGANVQVIAGGEIYPALERGAIDATEWVGPYDDEKLGFYKVAKNYYYPGWWEPGPSLSFYVNRKAWDSLPSSYQAAFEQAAFASGLTMQNRYDALNPPALKRLLAKGVKLRPFPQDLMDAAKRESQAMLEEEASKDKAYAKVYAHWQSYRTEAFEWFGKAELAYAKAAFGG